jgi:hypothetical protein
MKEINRITTINLKIKGGDGEKIVSRSEIHEGAGR